MSEPQPAAFSDQEEEFFRAGELISLPEPPYDELDDGIRPRSIWQRLFGRKSSRR